MSGARVRQVRELLGWTQTELRERASLSQSHISGVESGAGASLEVLAAISRATGFPLDWFTQEEEPVEFAEGTIRYRKTSRATKKDDRRAIRRLEVATEVVTELSRDRRIRPVTLQYLGAPKSDADIEDAAAATRAALEIPSNGPIRNFTRAVERAGTIVVGLPVDLGEAGRVQHHHGVSVWPDEDHRPVIGFSASDPGDRQRHTLGHELGHLVMHRGVRPDQDYEGEASRFSAAILMPLDDALGAMGHAPLTLSMLAKLKANWGISIAGLIMRAQHIGIIDRARTESLFKQISARGWRKQEPVKVHREQPALLPRLLEAQFGTPLDWSGIGQVLALPPHLLRELACVADRDHVGVEERASLPDELSARRESRLVR